MVKAIVIFEEKHSTRYFDASTEDALAAACLKILKERLQAGYWYYRNYEAPELVFGAEDAAIMAMTDEQKSVLPESVRADIEQKQNRLIRQAANYQREKALEDSWWEAVDLIMSKPDEEAIALTSKDVPSAQWGRWRLVVMVLEARSDGEYENFQVENLENVN